MQAPSNWQQPKNASPAPAAIAADWGAVFNAESTLSPKVVEAALKRLASALKSPKPGVLEFATTALGPWIASALVDTRNVTYSPLLFCAGAVATAVPTVAPLLTASLSNSLQPAVAAMDHAAAYPFLQSVFSLQFAFRAVSPMFGSMLEGWTRHAESLVLPVVQSSTGGDVLPAAKSAEVVRVLKLVALVLPKLHVDNEDEDSSSVPAALAPLCQLILLPPTTTTAFEPDLTRIASVILAHILLYHPAATPAFEIQAAAQQFSILDALVAPESVRVQTALRSMTPPGSHRALGWAYTLADRPLALMVRATVATLPKPHDAAMVAATVPVLLAVLARSGGAAASGTASTALSVLEALILVVPSASQLPTPDAQTMATAVLDATWAFLEDAADAIAAKAKQIVELVLPLLGAEPADLVARVLRATHPVTKVRFTVLTSLLAIPGAASAIWDAQCITSAEIVPALSKLPIVGRVTELVTGAVSRLVKKSRSLGNEERVAQSSVESAMAQLLVDGLLAKDTLTRKGTTTYLAKPLLAALPAIRAPVVAALRTCSATDDLGLAGLVTIERISRALDLPALSSDDSNDATTLTRALAETASPTLRLDALAIVAEVKKATTPLPPAELVWLQEYLELNLAGSVSDPEFREGLLARMGKILDRLRHSGYALGRAARAPSSAPPEVQAAAESARSMLAAYQAFLGWFGDRLARLLGRPGCPYPVAITALALVSLYAASFGCGGSGVPMPFGFSSAHCAVPVFPFPVTVDSEPMICALLTLLRTATYEEVQRSACALLAGKFSVPQSRLPDLLRWAQAGVASPRATEAHAGACMYDIAYLVSVRHQIKLSPNGSSNVSGSFPRFHYFLFVWTDECLSIENFIASLIADVQAYSAAVKSDLLAAAQSAPLPGTLQALQLILVHLDDPSILASPLFDLATAAIASVLPVLSDDAPEGNIPEHMRIGSDADDDTEMDVDGDNDEVAANGALSLSSQLILSFSWRVVKHACDMLGSLVDRIDPRANADLIARMGEYFIQRMLDIRHRGAFLAVSPNLVKVANTLAQYGQVPQSWLTNMMKVVAEADYSVTRRSGGLPSLLQALLTSPHTRHLVPPVMQSLLSLADAPPNGRLTVQVNAMNSLRRLLDDRNLTRDTPAFVEPAFVLSVQYLHHGDWGVRNGALMLYSALLNRTFGSRANAVVTESNQAPVFASAITPRAFFPKYRQFLDVIVSELATAAADTRNRVRGGTRAFPLLTLIARMSPSSTVSVTGDESAPMQQQASKFAHMVPLVHQFTDSPVWKVREMAAAALVALANRDELLDRARGALNQIVIPTNQNGVHGQALLARAFARAAWTVHGLPAVRETLARPALDAIPLVRKGRASTYAQAVVVEVAALAAGSSFVPIAHEWYRAVSTAAPLPGIELVKSELARVLLDADDVDVNGESSPLDLVLVQERNSVVVDMVLESLAHRASSLPTRLLSPSVVAWLKDPQSPHPSQRFQIMLSSRVHLEPSAILALLPPPSSASESPVPPALSLAVPLIQALASATTHTDTATSVVPHYAQMLRAWSDPDQPLPLRAACATSLADGLAGLAAHSPVYHAESLWIAATVLAQDDDSGVRETACAHVSQHLAIQLAYSRPGTVNVHSGAIVARVARHLVQEARRAPAVKAALKALWVCVVDAVIAPLAAAAPRVSGQSGTNKGNAAALVVLFEKEEPNQFKDTLEDALVHARCLVGIDAIVPTEDGGSGPVWARPWRALAASIRASTWAAGTTDESEREALADDPRISVAMAVLQELFGTHS
ncbi:putative death-receptor fusion protein-domain-containing protein [Blastocladiella britannica]|nr:putative death-receptor fusion protein-domain-containing protein [Blastocladiella britannica]